MERPDTTIGPNCGYVALRGKSLRLSPTVYDHVMDCSYGVCKANCCNHGCWVSRSRADLIKDHFEGIKPYLSEDAPKNIDELIIPNPKAATVLYDPIYEGMEVLQSAMNRKTGKCVFLTEHPDNVIGCSIHKYLHESGAADWHEVKPLGCILFPVMAQVPKKESDIVLLRRRSWKESRCCQLTASPEEGPRLIDVQKKSISKLFDIPIERLDSIIDWFEPSSVKRTRLELPILENNNE